MWSYRVTQVIKRCYSSSGLTTPTRERMRERWMTYWKGVWSDYTTVAKDVVEDARLRPAKAVVMALTAVAASYCAVCNPDEKSFADQLLSSSADLGMVSPELQNHKSAEHVMLLRSEFNERRLHRLNLLLCSIIYLDKNSQHVCTYDADCTYLRSSLRHFVNHIVDVGFLNRWWILGKNMDNYDVNY